VTEEYKEGNNTFTGKIIKVTIDVAPAKLSADDRKELEKAQAAAEKARE